MNSDLLKTEVESENTWSLAEHRFTSDETSAVRCYDQTRTRAASIFFIFPSDLGLHESTVGALGSHIAERKRVRAQVVSEIRCFTLATTGVNVQ